MKKIPWLFGNAMAGYMDFCVGLLIASLVAQYMHVELPLWQLGLAALFALLPDLDIVLSILSFKNPSGNHHLTLLHRPLLIVPIVGGIAFLLGGAYWGTTAVLGVLWHYFHDTKGLGSDGIAWAWPFSNRYLSPFGTSEPAHTDHETWLKENWLRLSPLSIREVLIGTIALAIVFIFLR